MLCTAALLAYLQSITPAGDFHGPKCVMVDARTAVAITGGELMALRPVKGGKPRRIASIESDFIALELQDLDADGTKEILVTQTPGNRSARIEIYDWTGAKFALRGEMNDHSRPIDLDHDGVPEIVEFGGGYQNSLRCVVAHAWVQRWRGGKLVPTKRKYVAFAEVTKRAAGPETFALEPYLDDVDSLSCLVHVVNGERGGGGRVTSLRMLIDKETKVATGVTAAREFIDLPLELPSRCSDIDVTVTGPAGAKVLVMLETFGAPPK